MLNALDATQRGRHQAQQAEVARARLDVELAVRAFDVHDHAQMGEGADHADAPARIAFEGEAGFAQPGGFELEARGGPRLAGGHAREAHRIESARVRQPLGCGRCHEGAGVGIGGTGGHRRRVDGNRLTRGAHRRSKAD
jgi:hypothetical protein